MVRFNANGVKDNFVKKFTSTSDGIRFNTSGEKDKVLSRELIVDAGIKSIKCGDDDKIVVKTTTNSEGRTLNSDLVLNMFVKSMRTLSGTMHINIGDTECIEVKNEIIFVDGNVVNVVDIAVSKFINMHCGNSAKRKGVVVTISNRFSISVEISPFTCVKELSGFSKFADNDVGIELRVDGATVDNVCKKCITECGDRILVNDNWVIKSITTRGCKSIKENVDADKTSIKLVTI